MAVFARNKTTGQLTQLALATGCVSETVATCASGRGLLGATGIAVSADGAHVYVASPDSHAVAIFVRNSSTGKLTQLADPNGCITESATPGCETGKALLGALGVTVGGHGRNVYVASPDSNGVAVFARDPKTGKLTHLPALDGCVVDGGSPVCAAGIGLGGAASVVVSDDKKHVYVASSTSDAVAVFLRDKETGKLTQRPAPSGCLTSQSIAGCTSGVIGLEGAMGIVISPAETSVYVASSASHAVAAFSRKTGTGVLTPLAVPCVGGAVGCVAGIGLEGATSVAISPDKKSVYVTGTASDAVAVFSRQ